MKEAVEVERVANFGVTACTARLADPLPLYRAYMRQPLKPPS
ncbi:MAG: hypothetical protein R2703_06835 [Micropruina glycogenica]